MIEVLLVTICLAAFPYQGSSIILESGNVNDYEVVYPRKITALSEGAAQQKYEDTMQYEFKVNGEPVVLHLEKNKELFAKDYSETHYSPDGTRITTYPSVEDHCYYQGRIHNDADSTASISTCNGLKGHFKFHGERYFIEPLKLPGSEAHAVYKYENIEKEDETPKMCGVIQKWKSDELIKKPFRLNLTPQQQESPQAKVYLVIVADKSMVDKHNGNIKKIEEQGHQMVNTMNECYRPMGIIIIMAGIECWTTNDFFEVKSSAKETLYSFAKWRVEDLSKRKPHNDAQFLTNKDFDGNTVGLAFVGGICNEKYCAGVVQDHTKVPLLMAITMGHEIGHNLGMEHDEANCKCKACVMAPEVNNNPTKKFSDCSRNYYQKFLKDRKPECLFKKPLRTDTVSTPVSGNEPLEVITMDDFYA
uniref:Snake venom metalloproteinase kistomin n=1 Tax=Calloselasma rhodostoma TaxID=8717 RepID=VM1K_CALRH|nr:RecName: Full=Snake venom metalloproteinase kistomin; Short=SVMP; Flags: Precursor [Calloselasma rhodostoma]